MKTQMQLAIEQYENRIGLTIKPDKRLYSKVGINQKRFGQLLRGEKPMYGYEALSLSRFLGMPLETLLHPPVAVNEMAVQKPKRNQHPINQSDNNAQTI